MRDQCFSQLFQTTDKSVRDDIMEVMNNSFLKHGAIDPMHSINLLNVASILEDREFIQYVVNHDI